MNYVAIYLTSYLVSGPMSAGGVANSQSPSRGRAGEAVSVHAAQQPMWEY